MLDSKSFCRHHQDMSSRSLQDMFSRRPQRNNFSFSKTSSRRLGRQRIVTLKTYWKRLQGMSWRRLQDYLKTSKCLLGNNLFQSCFYILILLHIHQLQMWDLYYYFQHYNQYMQFISLTGTGFILMISWYVFLYLSTISFKLSIHIFWYCSDISVDFIFQSSNNSFSNNWFSFIVCWMHVLSNAFLYCYLAAMISLIYYSIHNLY